MSVGYDSKFKQIGRMDGADSLVLRERGLTINLKKGAAILSISTLKQRETSFRLALEVSLLLQS